MARAKTIAEQQVANDKKIIGLAARLVLELPLGLMGQARTSDDKETFVELHDRLRKSLVHGGYLARGAKP